MADFVGLPGIERFDYELVLNNMNLDESLIREANLSLLHERELLRLQGVLFETVHSSVGRKVGNATGAQVAADMFAVGSLVIQKTSSIKGNPVAYVQSTDTEADSMRLVGGFDFKATKNNEEESAWLRGLQDFMFVPLVEAVAPWISQSDYIDGLSEANRKIALIGFACIERCAAADYQTLQFEQLLKG